MISDSSGLPANGGHAYCDPSFQGLQQRLDELVQGGADLESRAKFITSVFVERNRMIRNLDFRTLNPSTIAEDYLLPRKDLYTFALCNWVRYIFLPSLKPKVVDNMLMFGLGRIFSSYNDTGVQHSTDADFNIIVRDAVTAADRRQIEQQMQVLKKSFLDNFQVSLEIDPQFTLLREKEVMGRLTHRDEKIRGHSLLFYKSNSKSIRVITDEASIRDRVFSAVRDLPDCLLFENFLGLGSPKPAFIKLHADLEPLPILVDGGCEQVFANSLIGSRRFRADNRRLFPPRLLISPPDWVFSMKYYVNRVYDYVGAMRSFGHDLAEIGFDDPSPQLGMDPDFRFLRNAHRLMLYLQELVQLVMKSFGAERDASYISRARFLRFMEIDGEKFKRDFDEMVLGGDLLLLSEKELYRSLKRRIREKSRERYMTGRIAELELLPRDFRHELIFKDKHAYKLRVPYSWADLGYFVFDAIAARMERIVIARLLPALARHGMGADRARRYEQLLGPSSARADSDCGSSPSRKPPPLVRSRVRRSPR